MPNGVVAWHFWLGAAAIMGFVALYEWQQPSLPPFTGRWSWIYEFAFALFGARGGFALFAILAACTGISALIAWLLDPRARRSPH